MKHLDNPTILFLVVLPLGLVAIPLVAWILVQLDPKPEQCKQLQGTMVKTTSGYQCINAQVIQP